MRRERRRRDYRAYELEVAGKEGSECHDVAHACVGQVVDLHHMQLGDDRVRKGLLELARQRMPDGELSRPPFAALVCGSSSPPENTLDPNPQSVRLGGPAGRFDVVAEL